MYFSRPIDHLNLTVPNLEEALAFYQDVMGFREEGRYQNNGKDFVFISDGTITYELFENQQLEKGIFGHIAYTTPDIKKEYETLKGKDPSMIVGEIGFASGLFAHGMYYFFIKGNGGESIEFCERATEKQE